MTNKLIQVTKLLLDAMFYLGILVTITLYFIFKFYGRYNSYFKDNVISLTVLFTFSGVFAVLIIYELRKMFKSVIADDCFIQENVVSLRKMGTYSFLIALTTAARLFIYITPGVIVVILVFLIAGLFSKVLSQVFDKAVTYKIENDLTI
jgi:hypothetical protein